MSDYHLGNYPNRISETETYCRSVNAILPNNRLICERCPLRSCDQGTCRYYREQNALPTKTPLTKMPELVRRESAAGREELFPKFVDAKRWPQNCLTLEWALQYAARAHDGAVRKGTRIPYIIHPIEVAMQIILLYKEGNDGKPLTDAQVETAATGALHDVVEDTDKTVQDIAASFNDRIAALVADESENKRPGQCAADTWQIRKEEALLHLRQAPVDAKIIALSDKFSNLRSIVSDYNRIGAQLWERFHQRDPKKHAWYYQSILDVVPELSGTGMYREYQELLSRQPFGRT